MADQERLSGAQILVEYLVRQGVTHVAGIPGHGCWAIVDALIDRREAAAGAPAKPFSGTGCQRRASAAPAHRRQAPGASSPEMYSCAVWSIRSGARIRK